jgi:hypothetical protein
VEVGVAAASEARFLFADRLKRRCFLRT